MNIENSKRVLSVDIFRGLTILVMIFVNDVASVKGLAWWTYHIPAGENGITYVDIVFPAFLFIVGMVIPLAIQRRLAMGDSYRQLWLHIVTRSLTLVAFGLLIMNGREFNPELSGISYSVWNVLMFVGAILCLNIYPKASHDKRKVYSALKWLGLAVLACLLIIYRRGSGDDVLWLDFKNWSILGGIGWSYLSVCVLFFLLRGKLTGLIVAFVLLNALNVGVTTGVLSFVHSIPTVFWPFGSGGTASIVLAGLIVSRIFLSDKIAKTIKQKTQWGIVIALLYFLVGWLLLPFGLAKIGATPSWCLYSAAICTIVFISLYWLVDVAGVSAWAKVIRPASSNALLLYILPDIYYAMAGVQHFSGVAGVGWPGVIKALLFTVFILGVGTLMTRWNVRLRL